MSSIAVLGTFDSKGPEHLFIRDGIQERGLSALTIHVGTKGPPWFRPDLDLGVRWETGTHRDAAIAQVIERARAEVRKLNQEGRICAIISAGGGTGTHLGTSVMRSLPFGFPKVMVSTVASRDMSATVGTCDITMIHSVADLLGINSITGTILDQATSAVCAMAATTPRPLQQRRRVALTMFGFVTEGASRLKALLEERGYEVVAFHANGTGGMALEELAAQGFFDGILDLALHELADQMMDGYCRGIGPGRLRPSPSRPVPRVVVPGGLDCAVLEFTRNNIPASYRDRKIFFYDFRSAIGLTQEESARLGEEVAERLSAYQTAVRLLVPKGGWSEADGPGRPLHDPAARMAFLTAVRRRLGPSLPVEEVDSHINEHAFARHAATAMEEMLAGGTA